MKSDVLTNLDRTPSWASREIERKDIAGHGLYHGVREPEPQSDSAKQALNILVQFVSDDDGLAMAPAVNLPADVSREGLELLLNKLTKSDDPAPFSFHVDVPENAAAAPGPTRIAISKSIQFDILNHSTHADSFTEEDIIIVRCSPQSVFRVRPATRCSASLGGHSSPILCASFSPTGNLLATGSGDATARLWDLNTETPSHTLVGHKGWVLCVEWEAMERLLATGGHDGHVRLWDPKSGKPVGDAMKGHTKWITSLSWEPIHLNSKSPRLASSSKDGTVRIWSTLTRRVEYTLGGHTASVNVVKWGGGGTNGFGLKRGVLYTASSDRTVRVWDAESGRQLHVLKDHAHWVTTLTLNTDFVLRTGPFDHTGKRPASDDEVLAQQLALKRYTTVLATTPELLITGSDDHTLFLWSLFPSSVPSAQGTQPSQGKLKPITRLTGHQRQISHVVFSPDGRWAASSSWDSSVRLWEGRTGKYVATLRGHVGAVYRLAWSADGRMLVSASKDATVKIWDLKTYKLKVDLPGHTDEVYCVDFVADKVVSGGRDKHVKILSRAATKPFYSTTYSYADLKTQEEATARRLLQSTELIEGQDLRFVKFRRREGVDFDTQQTIFRIHIYDPFTLKSSKKQVPLSTFLLGATEERAIPSTFSEEVCPEGSKDVVHIKIEASNEDFWNKTTKALTGKEKCIIVDNPILDSSYLSSSSTGDIWGGFSNYLPRYFRWPPHILDVVKQTQTRFNLRPYFTSLKGEAYLALHLHRDNLDQCKTAAQRKIGFSNWANIPSISAQTLPPLLDTNDTASVINHCYPPLSRILDAIDHQIRRKPYIRSVYIIHDAAASSDVRKLEIAMKNPERAQSNGWLYGPIKSVTSSATSQDELPMAVDVEIARRAEIFVGNGYSSLTSLVLALRIGGDLVSAGIADDMSLF
ncbi:hypothetical protein D9757_000546 [Collybiopsis confluens]|uniref:NLE domain-containing protein n=1 Tax=Collybiopsis confluens TaxID=2823264 RepID=A0A8H5MGQ7_9AGAR|nr:hypothetical protein D9757_000546 [Collybiopsis confluens]